MPARRSVGSAHRRSVGIVDTFTGANGSAPGSLWGPSAKSTGSTLDINNNQLRMVGGTLGNYTDYQYLPLLATATDFTLLIDVSLGTPTTAPHYVQIGFRGSGVQDLNPAPQGKQTTGYFVELGISDNYAFLARRSGGVDTRLGTVGITWADNDVAHVRVDAVGSSLQMWVWRNAATLPPSPQIVATDATYTSGKVWLGHNGGLDGTADTIRFDNLSVVGPTAPAPPPTDSNFHWGYMVTQDGMINYPAAQNATAKAALSSVPNGLMQVAKDHFGIYPVQYVPGAFDWGGDLQGAGANGIDDGVALIEAYRNKTNGHLMMQLYGIPGWQGGSPGNNFTSLAPDTLQHEQDYADDCARIAQRYNGTAGQPNIEYFAFWNENKGMDSYDATARAKNIRIYNKVWDAVKAVRPAAKIGGIYSKFISWEVGMGGAPASNYGLSLTYNGGFVDARVLDEYYEWRRDAHGFDFVAIDVWTGNDNHTSSTPVHDGITQYTQMKSKFPAVFAWVRGMFPGTPIICTETYIQGKGSGTGSPAETWTAADLENWMIEVLNDISPYGPGWICQWGEAVEPPPPIDYTTGAATTLIGKLITREGSL